MPFSLEADFNPPGHVLVVDDIATNVKLLATICKLAGFVVSTAPSGQLAIEAIAQQVPDVVLLDAMMPEMDGFETCRRIRENPATAHLPVVMVTALREVSDRVKALEAGADDFLTKPIEETEVTARIKTLVRAKRDRDALERAYRELRQAEEQRDSLTHMLVHDLRTPLTSILASLEILGDEKAGSLNEIQSELVSISSRGGRNLINLVNDLLNIAKLESGQLELRLDSISLADVADTAIAELKHQIAYNQVKISREFAPHLPPVVADPELLQRVFSNLIANAVKFSPSGGTVTVAIRSQDQDGISCMNVEVRDEGHGIEPEFQESIWEKFGQVAARRESNRASTGLGLTFCKLVVEAHGGKIGLNSQVDKGCTFIFDLPGA